MSKPKVALVTGASNGMGLETALAFAQKGIHVVLLCRNRARGEAAMARIQGTVPGAVLSLMLCDLGDMADIRRFCREFTAAYDHLNILVCNAGVLNMHRKETRDGLEEHFGVCHIGHFLLTNLLLPAMRAGTRIVMVSSIAHWVGRIDFDDLDMMKRYSVVRGYSRAKLCNLLFAAELSRRLSGTGITINCAHPGAVVTNIGAKRQDGKAGMSQVRVAAGRLLRGVIKTAEQGAQTAIYVATSDACTGVTGGYFANCRPAKASARASDMALAQGLWRVSEEITGR